MPYPHNIRKTIGKNKSRFISKKAKDRLLNMVKGTTEKREPCMHQKSETESNKRVILKVKEEKPYIIARTYLGGRRIIEWDKVADDLWCYVCNDSLSMRFAINERHMGLVSKVKVKCHRCQSITTIGTSIKSNKDAYDTNLKAAIGMLDAGMGETATNTFISALNIPAINHKSLKRFERYVGIAVEDLSNESCVEAIDKEKLLSKENEIDYISTKNEVDKNDNEVTDLTASFHGAWTKRGRQHNSFSGHASLIGNFSKKVIVYACRNIYCRRCKINKPHDACKRNHDRSSKAMEADMAVELVLKNQNLISANYKIKTIIGDDDSSAIASLRRLSPYAIIKFSDFNHVKKTFNNKLYEIKLKASLMEYFSKVFCVAIKRNKGNQENVKLALENIVPHAFGNHQNCDSFCIKANNQSHTYKYFKDGVCLSDGKLKEQLTKILQPYINSSSQIAPGASSQANESFNHTVCSKHPKSHFYGGSESHTFRVAIAVCQKNLGYEYIIRLNEKLNLSPEKYTQSFRKRKQNVSFTQAQIKTEIPVKKRRLYLKKDRSKINTTLSTREGISYHSGSGYLNTSDLINEVPISENVNYEDCCLVIFDIETTGLRVTDEIVQIAAVREQYEFDVYIMPKTNMDQNASQATGIQILNSKMYLNEKQLISNSPRAAFISFLYFLKLLKKPVILVAHNGKRFDIPRIIKLATSVDLLQEFQRFVKGFCDTLYLFKQLLPNRLRQKKSFSQPSLVQDFLESTEWKSAHNALNDVLMLNCLIQKFCTNKNDVYNNCQSFHSVLNEKIIKEKEKELKKSLLDLKISTNMKSKLAKAGISKAILQTACETGYEGLLILLSENVGGKPRVTRNIKIIKTIFEQLEQKR